MLALIIGVLALIILLCSVPERPYKARGIALPAAEVRPATSADQVRIYTRMPFDAIQLGFISIEKHYVPGNFDSAVKAMSVKAKVLAASLGANAVVVTNQPIQPSANIPSALQTYYYLGVAVYTQQLQPNAAPAWLGHYAPW